MPRASKYAPKQSQCLGFGKACEQALNPKP